MVRRHLRKPFSRGLIAVLALGLLPSPLFLSWLLSRTSGAQVSVSEDSSLGSALPKLSDVAPRQPVAWANPAPNPRQRLESLDLLPIPGVTGVAIEPEIDEREAYDLALEELSQRLGENEAQKILDDIANPKPANPTLAAPNLQPPRRDPFASRPKYVDYRR